MLALASTVASAQGGKPWSWGLNIYGQLGYGTTVAGFPTPSKVVNLSRTTQISSGSGSHTLALQADGTVWAWGWNQSGELGDGTHTNQNAPVQVSGLKNIVQVSATEGRSFAVKSDGTVYAWGNNVHGELGDGTNRNRIKPVKVLGLANVVQVTAGRTSFAVKSDGTLWAWGYNQSLVNVTQTTNVVQVAESWEKVFVLLADGTVWQLPSLTDAPVQVAGLSGITQITAGRDFQLVLKSDGTVWAWGNNWIGQLGDGTTNFTDTPVQVSGLTNAVEISAGTSHSVAVKSDGTLWAWGNDIYGELGIGKYDKKPNYTTPQQVLKLTAVSQVAAGDGFTVAINAIKTKIVADNKKTPYAKSFSVTATLKDENKVVVDGVPVQFAIDDVVIGTANTNKQGIASLAVPTPSQYNVGAHTVTATFAGNKYMLTSTATGTITVTKADTLLVASNLSAKVGDKKFLTATLKRATDKARLSNTSISFNLDGTLLGTASTDGTGKGSFAYTVPTTLSVGAHKIKVEYAGDANHNASKGEATLTIK